MTKREGRLRELLELVRVHRRLDVKTVASRMGVSDATVRRMFAELESEGKVLRVHGGVQLASTTSGYSFVQSEAERTEHKAAIGRLAAGYVEDGSWIFIDSGTTLLRAAECIRLRLDDGTLRDIVVLTNSLNIIEILASSCKVIMTGGEVRMSRRDMSGTVAEKMLSRFRVSRSFLGADAVSLEGGFMTTDEQTASVNEVILTRSDSSFVLADSLKFGRKSFVSYGSVDLVSGIITDWELSSTDVRTLEAAGAHIILATAP